MGTESIQVSALIPAPPDRVYAAWLDSATHSAMTGGAAEIDPRVGGRHHAWDGYISGKTRALTGGKRIVQSWRSTEFPKGSADSTIVVMLEREGDHTRITIDHVDIPEGQGARYQDGWHEYYFAPMTAYFRAETPANAKPTRARRAPAKTAVVKTAASKKAVPKKAALKAAAPKKAASKKAVPKKAALKAAAPKKAVVKKAAPKKAAAEKAAPKKAVVKKAAPKKAGSKQSAKAKATAAKRPAARKAPARGSASVGGATRG